MIRKLKYTFPGFIQQLFIATSIKQKLMLIIMSVSLIGLGTVSASILINELINLNKIQKIDLKVTADIVADTSSGFVVFGDEIGATASLTALRAKKQITKAIIFDTDKYVFATHIREGDINDTYETLKKEAVNYNAEYHIWKDIVIDGDLIGYLYVESDGALINEFIQRSIIGMVLIMTLGLVLAYLMASKFQKLISVPIEHLTETASRITELQNYDLRAEKESSDEIGVLTDEFNKMLSQLDIRNRKLLESENKFKEVVEQSVDALFIIDNQGGFLDVNNAACDSLGYTRDELMAMKVEDVDRKWRDKAKLSNVLKKLKKERHVSVDGEHVGRDGKIIPVEIRLGFVNIESNQYILASARNITERLLAQKKLQEANDLLEAKVNERTSELKAANAALSIAKEKAEAANHAKSLFLANMSHEIRTPMNAVIGFTDVLSSSELTQQQMGYVKSIQSGGRNLLSLINDILDLSKIEAGKMKIQFDEVNIRLLLEDIVQVFSMSAKEKGLLLTLKVDPLVPNVIMSDEIRVRQVIFNLLSNAIKFTHIGEVSVSVKYELHDVANVFPDLVIEVADTGIGVAESDRENIFNIFEQQDNQSTREFGGAGLGLAISKRLAEKLNAEISLKSEVNKGSVFRLILKSPEIVEDGKGIIVPPETEGLKFKKAKILIVDDIDINRELIGEYLSGQEFELLHADNGQVAIDKIKMEKPDIVLMDIRMPGMSGIEATQVIKKDPQYKDIPIIAITASVVEDKKVDKKRSLFDSVLYKPLNRKTLTQCLTKFIEVEGADENEPHSKSKNELLGDFENAGSQFVKAINEYLPELEKAKGRGSFAGLGQLLQELSDLSSYYEVTYMAKIIGRLRSANQQFDIEETQKLLSSLIIGIKEFQGPKYDKTI